MTPEYQKGYNAGYRECLNRRDISLLHDPVYDRLCKAIRQMTARKATSLSWTANDEGLLQLLKDIKKAV